MDCWRPAIQTAQTRPASTAPGSRPRRHRQTAHPWPAGFHPRQRRLDGIALSGNLQKWQGGLTIGRRCSVWESGVGA
eukprot:347075-Chlamydomonas_euryale.AAC.3